MRGKTGPGILKGEREFLVSRLMEKRCKLGRNMAKIDAYRLLIYLTLKQQLVKLDVVQTLVVTEENRFIKTPHSMATNKKGDKRMIPKFLS